MEEQENRAQKPQNADLGGVKSLDGVEISAVQIDTLTMVLAQCTPRRLEEIGQKELIHRIVENFIIVNTKKDIDAFITHHVCMKLANLFTGLHH